jgi:hypothetical protein
MRRVPWRSWLALAGAVLASGCARATVTTDIKADGAWTRTLNFRSDTVDRLHETFALPFGAPWKVSKEPLDGEVIYIAGRTLRPGETLRQDLVLREADKGKATRQLVNEVSVREVVPGKLEYREVLHWQGKRLPGLASLDRKLLGTIKAALPAALANDADSRDVAQTGLRAFWRIMLGPDDPLLAQASGHPDLAERRIRQRLAMAVDQALQAKFGDRTTLDERRVTQRKLVAAIMDALPIQRRAKNKTKPLELKESDTVPLAFVVRLPGKPEATNGELDEETGEVFWGLYSGAAAVEDVVMTASCDLGAVNQRAATPR